jgi:arabinogalactan endo-1,4-beta-galactosidase
MKGNINKVRTYLQNMEMKVVKVTKTNYTLENGDVYEHTFDIDENITVEEFQKLLDNARSFMTDTLKKIEREEL